MCAQHYRIETAKLQSKLKLEFRPEITIQNEYKIKKIHFHITQVRCVFSSLLSLYISIIDHIMFKFI